MVARELRDVLIPAYRCSAFDGACNGMRDKPEQGHFPRGYTGATGSLSDVKLVLVVAEPGEPPENARPQPSAEPADLVDLLASKIGRTFKDGGGAFHRNVRYLLERCWPGMPFLEQMKHTWITEGVLCSAAATTGPVPKVVETECAQRYLKKQLALLTGAFVIALGKKAESRLKRVGVTANAVVFAAGLPGGYAKGAKPSWDAAGSSFQQHVARVPPTEP